ncbi:MAG TPA: DUF4340 domain-containing protein [Clostridiaceae bacterium]|nr:DUF4340 domain-containing protein [Clostridiaceae bacterium]
MKLYRNAIILVVVLAVALGAFYFLKNRTTEENDNGSVTPAKYEKITDFDSLSVEKISVKYPDKEIVLTKTGDDEWQLESNKELKLNSSRVRSIAIRMSSIFPEKEIEENPKDLSVYGLDNPVLATCWLSDGSMHQIMIGDMTPTKGAYYGMVPGTDKVYTISTYDAGGILVSVNDLKLTTLFEVTMEDLVKLELERNGQLVFSSYKEEDEWRLSHPLKAKASYTRLYEIGDAISQFQVKAYEQDSSDLASFGLDNPKYALTFGTKDNEYRMLFGIEKGSDIYAKMDGSDDVFKLDVSLVNFLDVPIEEVVDSFVALPNIMDVEKVVVEIDGYTDVSEIYVDPEDSDKDSFKFNGKDANVKNEKGDFLYKKYYQGLLTAGIRDEVDIDGNPQGDAEVTITYYKTDGEVIKIEFVPRDEFYYYMVRNGEYTGLVVNKKKLSANNAESIRATRQALVEAMEKEAAE